MEPLDPTQANWAVVLSKLGVASRFEARQEVGMEDRIQTLKDRWESDEEPSEEISIMMTGSGEAVYIGRYPEGVVLRLNDRNNQVTFLTNEQLIELCGKLMKHD